MITIYTDGACSGNPGIGGWGVVILENNKDDIFLNGGNNYTTNNKMELLGVINGLKILGQKLNEQGMSIASIKVLVVTDSKYVIDGITKWVPGWKARGWKKADKKTPENVELWKQLDLLKDRVGELDFEWVKGHSGHPQNEHCDQMANIALDNEGF